MDTVETIIADLVSRWSSIGDREITILKSKIKPEQTKTFRSVVDKLLTEGGRWRPEIKTIMDMIRAAETSSHYHASSCSWSDLSEHFRSAVLHFENGSITQVANSDGEIFDIVCQRAKPKESLAAGDRFFLEVRRPGEESSRLITPKAFESWSVLKTEA